MSITKNKSLFRRVWTKRTSEAVCLLIGAGWVSLVIWSFSQVTDWGGILNHKLYASFPYLNWVLLPLGMMCLTWWVKTYAPYAVGSGIPQAMASLRLDLKRSPKRTALLHFWQTMSKIPLMFFALAIGASVGLVGPSVQLGAATMVAWGKFCRSRNIAFKSLNQSELIAAGAAGGLAAACNAPLAGMTFAIEEIGKGTKLRWDRKVLLGVMASGLILVATVGNFPYFPKYSGIDEIPYTILWTIGAGIVCGIAGGIFGKLVVMGFAGIFPKSLRKHINNHPYWSACFLGLVVATLGWSTNGASYGSGYAVASAGLNGDYVESSFGIAKFGATIATYWTGMAGGLFTPSVTIGSGIGATLSNLTVGLGIDSRFLVLMCMAGFLAGTSQAPLTAAVVTMEITDAHPEFIWLAITAMVSSVVARAIIPRPFTYFASLRFEAMIDAKVAEEKAKCKTAPDSEQPQASQLASRRASQRAFQQAPQQPGKTEPTEINPNGEAQQSGKAKQTEKTHKTHNGESRLQEEISTSISAPNLEFTSTPTSPRDSLDSQVPQRPQDSRDSKSTQNTNSHSKPHKL